MSHFVTWVLVEPENIDRAKERVDELLAPFDERGGEVFFETAEGTPAKWDWYEIGGRWAGQIPNDMCLVAELPEETPYAILTPTTGWHERAKMGWFGFARSDEKEQNSWDIEVSEILQAHRDHLVVACDCHI